MPPVKLDWKNIDPTKDFVYQDPRPNKHDGFSVPVLCRDPNTGNLEPILFQGPKMRIPFGMEGKNTPQGMKFYCKVSFTGVKQDEVSGNFICDSDDETNLQFFEFMRKIDVANNAKALEKCKLWFKKEMSSAVLEEFYHNNMNIPKDPVKYSPSYNTKLINNGTEFRTQFWNQKGEKIEYEDIAKGSTVIPLLSARGLWFANKSFGMSFQVTNLVVYEKNEFVGCPIDIPQEVSESTSESQLQIDIPEEGKQEETSRPSKRRKKKDEGNIAPDFNME